eukprot:TRINITY_DN15401_c0_g2_i1.p1 TRINITY_DN15401_c0_g2~~TRINITY_DN15401_c0_g2_i1.p1  ORF type:complete len:325 (+),score=64.25 TRINITY_DN15401_c0_g2_i1:118-1092(+)
MAESSVSRGFSSLIGLFILLGTTLVVQCHNTSPSELIEQVEVAQPAVASSLFQASSYVNAPMAETVDSVPFGEFASLDDTFDEDRRVQTANERATAFTLVKLPSGYAFVLSCDIVIGALATLTAIYMKALLFPRVATQKAKEKFPQAKINSIARAWNAHAASCRCAAALARVADENTDDVKCDTDGKLATSEAGDDCDGDMWGVTPLHYAAASGDVGKVKGFLRAGAFVDVRDAWGETPLHFAARTGQLEICKVFLSHGADINATGNEGTTALVVAARASREEVCQLLLFHGAGVAGMADDELPPVLLAMLVQRLFPTSDDGNL